MPSVDVSSIITNSRRHQTSSTYRMPVLSPRHSSSTTLSGSYRSTFSSSSIDRPYYGSTSSYTSPRLTSYTSDRYTSRSYSTAIEDGKKLYSRHSTISEDSNGSRYRDDSREKSTRRDSFTTRDSSARSNSLRDSSRELSLTRNDVASRSALSMVDSVADLRSKYSPANYVPAVLRKTDSIILRSKSINDIGKPPVEMTKAKKVNHADIVFGNGLKNCVAFTNLTNNNDDSNGNRTSVAEIRKKFDPNYTNRKVTQDKSAQLADGGLNKKNNTSHTPAIKELITNQPTILTTDNTKNKKLEPDPAATLVLGAKYFNRPPKCFKINDLPIQDVPESRSASSTESSSSELSGAILENGAPVSGDAAMDIVEPRHHTTNYASYIPIKDFAENDHTAQIEDVDLENNSPVFAYQQNRIINTNNDISTSPRLNRASIQQQSQAQSGSSSQQSGSNNLTTSSSRNSSSPTIDRDRNNRDDDRNNYTSASHSVRNQGLNGLKNIGNTCFMNSVIQCLSNTRYLLEYVKEDAYIGDINTTISGMKGALIKAFSQVIKELWSPDSSDRVVNTVALKSQIQRFAPRFMGYAQQDAQEFLRYLLEGLHEDVNRVVSKPSPILTEIEEKLSDSQKSAESWHRYLRMDNSKVVDIFVGQLKSTLRCTHCGHCSVTFDPFWDLSLPIPQRQGQLRLSQCLDHFTREETLDGDEKPTCAKCKERRKCTKSFSIQKFPKILVIHLKRFSPTERFRGKLSIVIDFPLQELDLSSCAANKSQTECMYNLYAISNHSGTTYSGHYTAYCKHPYNGQWHEYNDSRVSTISPKNVVSSEAYVLFYELVGQHSHL